MEITQRFKPDVVLQRAEIDMKIREVNTAARSVSISFSSENPVTRWDETEILLHTSEAVNFERLEAGLVCALFNHDTKEILGKIVNPAIDDVNKKCTADIIFDTDEDSEKIFQKVANGTLKGISVGYSVQIWEEVASGSTSTDGRFVGPCYIATRWTPLEISLVAVPADSMVGVGRSIDTTSESAGVDYKSEVKQLEKEEVTPAVNAEVQRDAIAAEHLEIMAICRDIKGLDAADCISKKMTPAEVAKRAVEELKKVNAPIEASREMAQVGDEAIDKFTRAATDGMLLRYNVATEGKAAEGAQELRGMPIRQLMGEYLRMTGTPNAHTLSPQEIGKRALTPGSQFLAIIDNTLNKSMLNAAQSAGTTYQIWTGKTTVTDFKSVNMYRLSSAGSLEKVTENGELKFKELSDEKVSMNIDTYGATFGFTRQMIINDDIGYMIAAPGAFARKAYRGINTAAYALLTTNATIYDGDALFSSGHANGLLSGGGVPTADAFAAGATAMGSQTDISGGDVLNLQQKYFISGWGPSFAAKTIINSSANPTASGNSGVWNQWQGSMVAVTDGAITDTKFWYTACDPNINATIVVGFLNGNDTPTIEMMDAKGEILGTSFRIYLDWGVKVADYRGLYCNKGQG